MFEKFEGFGHSVGLGNNVAIIVIDFIKGFTDSASKLGSDYSNEINQTKKLLTIARQKNIPIYFTTISYEPHLEDGGMFIKKVPALEILIDGSEWVQVDTRLGRKVESEPLITKKFASSFFGTTLASLLAAKQIDTIILAGATTSGCIRATAVDGLQYGYRVIIPEKCINDRSEQAHHANLYDINTKYGDVVKTDEIYQQLQNI